MPPTHWPSIYLEIMTFYNYCYQTLRDWYICMYVCISYIHTKLIQYCSLSFCHTYTCIFMAYIYIYYILSTVLIAHMFMYLGMTTGINNLLWAPIMKIIFSSSKIVDWPTARCGALWHFLLMWACHLIIVLMHALYMQLYCWDVTGAASSSYEEHSAAHMSVYWYLVILFFHFQWFDIWYIFLFLKTFELPLMRHISPFLIFESNVITFIVVISAIFVYLEKLCLLQLFFKSTSCIPILLNRFFFSNI